VTDPVALLRERGRTAGFTVATAWWSPPRRQLRRAERERRPGALLGHDAGPPRPHRDGELDTRAVRAARFASVPSFLGWLAR